MAWHESIIPFMLFTCGTDTGRQGKGKYKRVYVCHKALQRKTRKKETTTVTPVLLVSCPVVHTFISVSVTVVNCTHMPREKPV